jgi:ABC-type tungstate transport system permease subunit
VDRQEQLSEVQFVDDTEREYFAEAQLGLQVYDFLLSPAGRYLHGRAKLELQIVKDEMAELNPYSFFGKRKWRALKIRQETAESFMRWCAEAITTGSQAEKALEEYRP